MDLVKIKQIAFETMGSKSSHTWKEKGNKYYHGQRTANLIKFLRMQILPDDSNYDQILTVAAWFHDIKNGDIDHAEKGAIKVRSILGKYCTEIELENICRIIGRHDDRYSDRSSFSVYEKIHQDADHLDHFGTFDIWQAFIYTVGHGHTFVDVIDWLKNTRPTQDQKYRDELNFKISKEIYDEKAAFVRFFGDRMSIEGNGGIWNAEEIIDSMKGCND
jgi:uncharacterized protein